MKSQTMCFAAGMGAGLGADLLLRGIFVASAPGVVKRFLHAYDRLPEGTWRTLGVTIAVVGGLMVAQGIVSNRIHRSSSAAKPRPADG